MICIEAEVVRELPEMPPPTMPPMYAAVWYYIGPGCSNKTWKIGHFYHHIEQADRVATNLPSNCIHRRIVRVG